MPDLEFIGYSVPEREKLIREFTPRLQKLEFAPHIVFVRKDDSPTSVHEMVSSEEVPFLRIFTRSESRAKVLTETLKDLCDVEVIYIGMFTPQSK